LTPAGLRRIEAARARVRRHVWSLLPGGLPASWVADTDLGETVVLDVDATIVVAHSEKESAAPTFKGSFGFHPIGVWCDNTTELLAARLRPGNAGANTTADHLDVLSAAITQIPRTHRKHLLIRADGAGASHGLLDWLTGLNHLRGRRVDYSVGFALTDKLRHAIMLVPEKVWTPALDADGGVRAGGDVAELTGLPDLSGWPPGMRVIVRRERPHPGAQLSIFEERDGWRYQAFVTNTPTGQLPFLEARHRAHARVEDRIRHAKDTGLGRFPSRDYRINQAWLTATAIAADLIAWLRLLGLTPPGTAANRNFPRRLDQESSSVESARAASDELVSRGTAIDAVLLNAGMVAGDAMGKSVNGLGLAFASSIVGHHVLTVRVHRRVGFRKARGW
jgi:hypothetical protein